MLLDIWNVLLSLKKVLVVTTPPPFLSVQTQDVLNLIQRLQYRIVSYTFQLDD